MFWPIVLPFQITICIMTFFVLGISLFAYVRKRKFWKSFFISSAISCVVFIPSCALIATILDTQRFGIFEYASFDETNDFRIQRYLPPNARDITVHKFASGHRARYTIEEEELRAFLDTLWVFRGERSPDSKEKSATTLQSRRMRFGGFSQILAGQIQVMLFDWPAPLQPTEPVPPIFYCRSSQTAYHYAGYW